MTILYLMSRVHLASFVVMLPKQLKYSTFYSCFWSIIICTVDDSTHILSILDLSIFTYILQHLPIPVSLSIMPSSTVSSSASSKSSSAYFTLQITCTPSLKSPHPARRSLVRHSLY
jgi:hypothetical protein